MASIGWTDSTRRAAGCSTRRIAPRSRFRDRGERREIECARIRGMERARHRPLEARDVGQVCERRAGS
jgi:hypothetical protein